MLKDILTAIVKDSRQLASPHVRQKILTNSEGTCVFKNTTTAYLLLLGAMKIHP